LSDGGITGEARLEVLGHTVSGAKIGISKEGLEANFTILGISLHIGPVTPSEIWSAIKSAAWNIINPYELAKKAAAAVAAGAKKVAGAVADGAKKVAGAVADGAEAAYDGAKSAAKKVGSFLSSAASSIFGGGIPLGDLVKQAREKLERKKAQEAAELQAL